MGTMEKKILDDLSVNLVKANQIEEETRAQHTCEKWVQERKFRLAASIKVWKSSKKTEES